MRLYYLARRNLITGDCCDASVFQIGGIFENIKGMVAIGTHSQHLLRFIGKEICQHLQQEQLENGPQEKEQQHRFGMVKDGEFLAHFFVNSGIATVAVTDKTYPENVVRRLLMQLYDTTTTTNEDEIVRQLKRYQDPAKADQLYVLEREVEETKEILHHSIDKILQREVKLEELIEKTENLSQETKSFYRKARKIRNPWWWCFPWRFW